jgi:hypothetical protein
VLFSTCIHESLKLLVFSFPLTQCIFSFPQTVVQRGIAMEGATDALIQLIKDHGRWVDPPAEE